MLYPTRLKFRKYQKGRIKGIKPNRAFLRFGRYGIKSLETTRIPARIIEAVRRVISRKFKRTGRIWIRIFPDIPVTSKPTEVRMGKGKGSPTLWICRIKPGQLLFEMDKIPIQLAKQAAILAYHKLPFKTKFVFNSKIQLESKYLPPTSS